MVYLQCAALEKCHPPQLLTGPLKSECMQVRCMCCALWPRGGSAVTPGAWAAGLTVLAGSVKFSEKLCKREGNTKALRNGQPGSRPLPLSLTLRFLEHLLARQCQSCPLPISAQKEGRGADESEHQVSPQLGPDQGASLQDYCLRDPNPRGQ